MILPEKACPSTLTAVCKILDGIACHLYTDSRIIQAVRGPKADTMARRDLDGKPQAEIPFFPVHGRVFRQGYFRGQ